ncbi:MAG: WD40 repeat domain-containing protein [Pseudonocardiaceae bacterium]
MPLRHPRFRDAVADLAAPLHGVAKEQLVGEDVRQQRRTVRWRNSAIAALVILSLLAGISSVQFFLQRNLARDPRDLAISRQLAAQSSRMVETRPEAAILVGLESLRMASAQNPQPPAGFITGLARLNHASHRYGSISAAISVAFNPDGSLLAFGDESGSVQIWNVAAQRPEGERLVGHTGSVQGVAFSPNGQMLASTGDMIVQWW